jgi:UDP-N-acetylmuramoyl-tripeptide--D-alanyl-D-alanine ligase
MPEFPAQLLATWTGGTWTTTPAAALTGFHFDTRKLRAGDVFVALKTEKRDGHEFLADAQAAGAAAALVSTVNPAVALPQLLVIDPLRAFHAIAREHRRTFRGPVIGISGSAGKTSTKDLLGLLLGGASCGVAATEGNLNQASRSSGASTASGVLATEGNLNNHLGVPLTLTRIDPASHRFAVVEAGISTPGEMQPLADMIAPDVSLITLIAPAHTEELGGIDGVAREKAVLPAATSATGVAIFSRETAEFPAFRELGVRQMVVERAEVVRPAEPPKDKVFFAVSHRAEETAVSLAYGKPPPLTFVFRRVSDGMAQNAALAICAALWLGVSRTEIQSRLRDWKPGRLRGEIRHVDGRLLYLDCYNANPASMADALETFYSVAPASEPRLYVLGCMEELGAEAPAHHRALGRSLRLRDQDQLFVIGTQAHEVCAGVLEQGDHTDQIQIAASLDVVSAFLAEWRGTVFVKGSRRYQLEKILEVQTSLPLSC